MGANPARKIGAYTLGEKIRSGPHLAVFTGTDNLGREIEIACYRAVTLRDRTGRDAFLQEARSTAALHHENLCPMVDAGEEGEIWYAVSVSPDAPSLRDLLSRGGALAAERVRRLAEGAAEGLRHLAGAGLRHGDLRPETVFLSGGRVLLAPRRLIPLAPRERDPRYLAPEELRAEGTDIRADLFALGVVLAQALTGAPPFAGESAEEVLRAVAGGPPPLPADTPADLAALIAALLAEDPDDRPSDPGTIARALSGEIRLATPAAAAPAPAPLPAGPESPAAAPAPKPVRRGTGRLRVPSGRDGAARWDLVDDRTFLAPGEKGPPEVTRDESDAAVARIDRDATGDVLHALPGRDPHARVNGSLVDRHELAPGDRIRIGKVEVEYETVPEPAGRAAPARPRRGSRRSLLVPLATLGLCLLVVGFALWRASAIRGKGEETIQRAEEAEARLADRSAAGGESPPITPELRAAARKAFDEAKDFAAKNPGAYDAIRRRFETVRRLYGPTSFGYLAAEEIKKLDVSRKERVAAAYQAAVREAGRHIEDGRLYDALELYRKFAEENPDTLSADRAEREATNLEEAIASRFQDDRARAAAAIKAGDFGVALDILSAAETYGGPEVRKDARETIDAIRRRIQETQVPGGEPADPDVPPDNSEPPPPVPPVPPDGGEGPEKPPPPQPPPAGPEEARAEAMHQEAVQAFTRKRWDRVIELVEKLGKPPFAATKYVTERQEELHRLAGLARLERDGVAGLFAGAAKVVRGREIVLTYEFDSDAELRDWTFINPFADPGTGHHSRGESSLYLRGIGAMVHSAIFEPGTLEMKANVQAVKPRDFGFQMFEPETMMRFYLFAVQNRYFTIGAERTPVHENAVWVFGSGAWADTPNGELGYIYLTKSPTPAVSAGEWLDIVGKKAGKRVSFAIKGTPPINGSAMGDNNYVFPALQPALYVLHGDTVWDSVEIHGVLQQEWAEKSMARARRQLGAD